MDIASLGSSLDSRNIAVAGQMQDANVEQFRSVLDSIMVGSRDRDSEVTDAERIANRAQIREAAEMFEAHFLQMMFKEMRRTNFNEDGFFSRNNAENIWTEMFDEKMADMASQTNNGMGIADMIYRQMTMRYRDEV